MKKKSVNVKDMDLLRKHNIVGIDLSQAVCFTFEQGEYLFHEGDPLEYLYFIVSGRARMYQNAPNGRRLPKVP